MIIDRLAWGTAVRDEFIELPVNGKRVMRGEGGQRRDIPIALSSPGQGRDIPIALPSPRQSRDIPIALPSPGQGRDIPITLPSPR